MGGTPVGIFFQWQYLTPFGIRRVSDYLLDPPPALTSNRYARAYNEVKTVGSLHSTERPQDRTNVVLFYAASSATLVFNQAARQIAQQQGRSLIENARALALINMAISDGFVASFFNKYHYNFWRPETAIHEGESDGNPKTSADGSFVPFVSTPCFPSYPSNHGSGTGAGAEVSRLLYGESGHSITISNPAVPNVVLRYSSFQQIINDVSDARVYAGIHFRTDQQAGTRLGISVARGVYRHNLQPLQEKDDD